MKSEESLADFNILLVEDDEHDRLAFARALKKSNFPCQITACERAEEALELLGARTASFDLLVVDQGLPGMSGLEMFARLPGGQTRPPLVILTGAGSEYLAVEALKAGVEDYLVKDSGRGYLSLLPVVLSEAVRRHGDRRARLAAERALQESENRYRSLFEDSPTALWEIDLSWSKTFFDRLSQEGINLRDYFETHPEVVDRCLRSLQVCDINRAGLELFGARSKEQLLQDPGRLFVAEPWSGLKKHALALAEGQGRYQSETVCQNLAGQRMNIILRTTVAPGQEKTLARVLVVFVDITERKLAEEALREARDSLEERVRQRTAELETAVVALQVEIVERKLAEENVRRLSRQLLRAHEDERLRFSRELHDSLAQDLCALKIGLDTALLAWPTAPPEMGQRMAGLTKSLEDSISAVQNLAYDLRPFNLDQLGLGQAVSQHCQEFTSATGVQVDLVVSGVDDLNLNPEDKINLFRLIQEGLNNVRKHAQARRVVLRLLASHPKVILHLEDDGLGFDLKERMNAALNEKRMGLQSMKERVGLLRGEIQIVSRPMKGTKILVEVPLQGDER